MSFNSWTDKLAHLHQGILPSKEKKMSYWYRQQLGYISVALCQVKEAILQSYILYEPDPQIKINTDGEIIGVNQR